MLEEGNKEIEIPSSLPVLPVRDIVVFPYMILPLFIGRESSIKAVDECMGATDRLIFLASQKDMKDEFPQPEDIHKVGVVAMVMRMRKLPDGRTKILVQGLTKAKVDKYNKVTPYLEAKVERQVEKVMQDSDHLESEALTRNIKENLEKITSFGKTISPDVLLVFDDFTDAGRLADMVASHVGLKIEEAQDLLEENDPMERLRKVNDILIRELEVLTMQVKIRSQAKGEINKSQREYFLREQMRAIKSELGDSDSKQEESMEFRKKIIECKMPEEAETEALKQLSRLDRMHPDSSEASILRGYMETLVDLPWSKCSEDNLDLKNAKKILDEDHFDLKKIKERCLEYLAVRKLNKKMSGPILCFLGPPGVGKTSLGKSIARALGRKFYRISLGGLKDEAEIRGHRRTYVGAMPGKILHGLKICTVKNPVFMLDEIDKLGSDFRGDPSSALLEVLDAEQNSTFRDHYLNLPFDLSDIIFLATANMIDTIPPALKDRLEVIQLSGYSEEEKLKIAKQYLIPKQIQENGIEEKHVSFPDEGIHYTIENYTREAGLRNLERTIGTLCRKVAFRVAEGEDFSVEFCPDKITSLLGPAMYSREDAKKEDSVGVSTGLAWTQAGGEILHIETSVSAGRGNIILTGQMGDVMKESAKAALGYIRSNAEKFHFADELFTAKDLHIHIPSGAIPKDGPSAGLAMAVAIFSSLSGIPVRKDVAMTGEISLTGRALPIGGLKEKALAAMRSGVTKIIIPDKNVKDLEELDEEYRNQLEFFPVDHISRALEYSLSESWDEHIQEKEKKAVRASKVKISERRESGRRKTGSLPKGRIA